MLKFSKEIENVFKSKLELVRQIDVNFLNDIIGMDLDRNSKNEFLAQYIIVSPILRKLFNHNLINLLDEKVKSISDVSSLSDFYNSIDYNSKDRQTLITSIFEFLIRAITPRQQEKLGVVYTPIEVVDFINQSVSDILDKDFGCSLKDVEVLDPFTGVGIFLERLNTNLKCGYEIMPLSCFIARLNTNANIKLVDTFTTKSSNKNKIKVIIGNPPYSVGQKSANDNNPNDYHEYVSKRLKETYVKESSAQNKNRLYDLYIKSFRWASDNLGDKGIIAFVTNGSWIYENSFDGMRKCILDEFDTIYIYDLKGNARTSGVQRQKEGSTIFNDGSRCPIAITFLVRNPKQSKTIKYDCVDDYLTREQKLEKLKSLKTIFNVNLKEIKPDAYNDWFKKRDYNFSKFIALGSKKKSNELKIFKQ